MKRKCKNSCIQILDFIFLEGASTNKKGSKRSLDFETNRDQSDIQPTPLDGSIEVNL